MILVTGANGFVGARVLARLRRDAEPLVALLGSGGDASPPQDGVRRVVGRIERAESYRAQLEGVHTVVHLASKHVDVDGTGFERTNVDGTRALAGACRDAGVGHVIYLSSTGVYGHDAFDGADERTPRRPDTALARSKAAAEDVLVRELGAHFASTVLRPRFVHGPGDRAFVPAIERAVDRQPLIPLSGRARVSLVHVDDLAEVIARLVRMPPAGSRTLHVTDGHAYRMRELFETVAAARGTRAPRFVPVPLPLLYHPLRLVERIAGIDPEARVAGLTSRRLQFLGQDNHFSSAALARLLPDLRFRRFATESVTPHEARDP